jgi:hypothetical protein
MKPAILKLERTVREFAAIDPNKVGEYTVNIRRNQISKFIQMFRSDFFTDVKISTYDF